MSETFLKIILWAVCLYSVTVTAEDMTGKGVEGEGMTRSK